MEFDHPFDDAVAGFDNNGQIEEENNGDDGYEVEEREEEVKKKKKKHRKSSGSEKRNGVESSVSEVGAELSSTSQDLIRRSQEDIDRRRKKKKKKKRKKKKKSSKSSSEDRSSKKSKKTKKSKKKKKKKEKKAKREDDDKKPRGLRRRRRQRQDRDVSQGNAPDLFSIPLDQAAFQQAHYQTDGSNVISDLGFEFGRPTHTMPLVPIAEESLGNSRSDSRAFSMDSSVDDDSSDESPEDEEYAEDEDSYEGEMVDEEMYDENEEKYDENEGYEDDEYDDDDDEYEEEEEEYVNDHQIDHEDDYEGEDSYEEEDEYEEEEEVYEEDQQNQGFQDETYSEEEESEESSSSEEEEEEEHDQVHLAQQTMETENLFATNWSESDQKPSAFESNSSWHERDSSDTLKSSTSQNTWTNGGWDMDRGSSWHGTADRSGQTSTFNSSWNGFSNDDWGKQKPSSLKDSPLTSQTTSPASTSDGAMKAAPYPEERLLSQVAESPRNSDSLSPFPNQSDLIDGLDDGTINTADITPAERKIIAEALADMSDGDTLDNTVDPPSPMRIRQRDEDAEEDEDDDGEYTDDEDNSSYTDEDEESDEEEYSDDEEYTDESEDEEDEEGYDDEDEEFSEAESSIEEEDDDEEENGFFGAFGNVHQSPMSNSTPNHGSSGMIQGFNFDEESHSMQSTTSASSAYSTNEPIPPPYDATDRGESLLSESGSNSQKTLDLTPQNLLGDYDQGSDKEDGMFSNSYMPPAFSTKSFTDFSEEDSSAHVSLTEAEESTIAETLGFRSSFASSESKPQRRESLLNDVKPSPEEEEDMWNSANMLPPKDNSMGPSDAWNVPAFPIEASPQTPSKELIQANAWGSMNVKDSGQNGWGKHSDFDFDQSTDVNAQKSDPDWSSFGQMETTDQGTQENDGFGSSDGWPVTQPFAQMNQDSAKQNEKAENEESQLESESEDDSEESSEEETYEEGSYEEETSEEDTSDEEDEEDDESETDKGIPVADASSAVQQAEAMETTHLQQEDSQRHESDWNTFSTTAGFDVDKDSQTAEMLAAASSKFASDSLFDTDPFNSAAVNETGQTEATSFDTKWTNDDGKDEISAVPVEEKKDADHGGTSSNDDARAGLGSAEHPSTLGFMEQPSVDSQNDEDDDEDGSESEDSDDDCATEQDEDEESSASEEEFEAEDASSGEEEDPSEEDSDETLESEDGEETVDDDDDDDDEVMEPESEEDTAESGRVEAADEASAESEKDEDEESFESNLEDEDEDGSEQEQSEEEGEDSLQSGDDDEESMESDEVDSAESDEYVEDMEGSVEEKSFADDVDEESEESSEDESTSDEDSMQDDPESDAIGGFEPPSSQDFDMMSPVSNGRDASIGGGSNGSTLAWLTGTEKSLTDESPNQKQDAATVSKGDMGTDSKGQHEEPKPFDRSMDWANFPFGSSQFNSTGAEWESSVSQNVFSSSGFESSGFNDANGNSKGDEDTPTNFRNGTQQVLVPNEASSSRNATEEEISTDKAQRQEQSHIMSESKRQSPTEVKSNDSRASSSDKSRHTEQDVPVSSEGFSGQSDSGEFQTPIQTGSLQESKEEARVDEDSSVEDEPGDSNQNQRERFDGSFSAKEGLIGNESGGTGWPPFSDSSKNDKALESTPNVTLQPFPPFSTEEVSPMTQDFTHEPPFANEAMSPTLGDSKEEGSNEPFPDPGDTFDTKLSTNWDPFSGSNNAFLQNDVVSGFGDSVSAMESIEPKPVEEVKPSRQKVDSSGSDIHASSASGVGSSDVKSHPSSVTEPRKNGNSSEGSNNTRKWNSGLADNPSSMDSTKAARGADHEEPSRETTGTRQGPSGARKGPSPHRNVIGQPTLPEMNNQWDIDETGTDEVEEKATLFEEPAKAVPESDVIVASIGDEMKGLNIANDPRAQELLVMYLKSMGTSTKTARVIASTFVDQQKAGSSAPSSQSPSPGGASNIQGFQTADDRQDTATRLSGGSGSQNESRVSQQSRSKVSALVSGSAGILGAPNTLASPQGAMSLDDPSGFGVQQQGMPVSAYDQGHMNWMGNAGSVSLAAHSMVQSIGHQDQFSYHDPYVQSMGVQQEQYPSMPGAGGMLVNPQGQYPAFGDPGYDLEYGMGYSQGNFVEARAVKLTNEPYYYNDSDYAMPVAYADDSPLSMRQLVQENGVRKFFIFCGIVVFLAIAVVVVVMVKEANEPDRLSPTASPSLQPSMISEDLFELAVEISGTEALNSVGSPQRRAVGWMSTFDAKTNGAFVPAFTQRYALVVLYFSTNGDEWVEKERWLDPTLHECSWSDTIFCKRDGSLDQAVNGLDMTKNNLVGPLPNEIGRLSQLDFLRVSQNRLQGPLPPALFSTTRVSVVDISQNEITGGIPDSVADARDLVLFDASLNNMTGSIPDNFYSLSVLRVADLHGNRFSGSISPRLGELRVMTNLLLNSNQLTGTLPSLGRDSVSALQVVNLENNLLSGNVPDWLFEPVRQEVTLSHNKFSGTLRQPDSRILNSNDIKIRILDLSHNELTGPVPQWITMFTTLQTLDLSHNQHTGRLPVWGPGLLRSLENLRLSYNEFTGTIPTSIPENLQTVDYAGNRVTGDIPTALCQFTSLQGLYVDNNTLGSSVAPILRCARGLKTLSAEFCGLTGAIPDDLKLEVMEILKLGNNSIAGTLPSMIGEFRSLKQISLQSNSITGTLPSELGTLDELLTLNLEYNDLIGPVPTELGQFLSLTRFTAVGNRLQGRISNVLCRSVGNFTREEIGCALECSCCVDPNNFCADSINRERRLLRGRH